jgi:hypothetical protein
MGRPSVAIDVVKQHVIRARAWLAQSLAARLPNQQADRDTPTEARECFEVPAERVSLHNPMEKALEHCDRALGWIDRIDETPSDTECVRQQLVAVAPLCVRRIVSAHPFGSTVAQETNYEAELTNDSVEIPVETECLPYQLDAIWSRGNVELQLGFHLKKVDLCPASSWYPQGVKLATYDIDLKS